MWDVCHGRSLGDHLDMSSPAPRRGFTLLELILVVVVVGIFTAVSVNSFLQPQSKGEEETARMRLGQLQVELAAIVADSPSGGFPQDRLDRIQLGGAAVVAGETPSGSPVTVSLETRQGRQVAVAVVGTGGGECLALWYAYGNEAWGVADEPASGCAAANLTVSIANFDGGTVTAPRTFTMN